VLYQLGRGVPQDEAEGRTWLQRAADRGDGTAKFYLYRLADASTQPLPPTERFMGIISACATSNKVYIDGTLDGSIRSFYEGQRTAGKITVLQTSDFLSLFPEDKRQEAYKLYTGCVHQLVNSPLGGPDIKQLDVTIVSRTSPLPTNDMIYSYH
jgi:hypothetical protein